MHIRHSILLLRNSEALHGYGVHCRRHVDATQNLLPEAGQLVIDPQFTCDHVPLIGVARRWPLGDDISAAPNWEVSSFLRSTPLRSRLHVYNYVRERRTAPAQVLRHDYRVRSYLWTQTASEFGRALPKLNVKVKYVVRTVPASMPERMRATISETSCMDTSHLCEKGVFQKGENVCLKRVMSEHNLPRTSDCF